MMNIGIAEPEPGYLQGLKDLLHRHGALLIFDEVKSGRDRGRRRDRALRRAPDLACFAKAIGGGTPGAAFGGRADVMEVIERGAAHQGTFNGNPLVCAAGLAALTEVLTPDAYVHLGGSAPAWRRGARPRCRSTTSPATPSISARRVACRTARAVAQLPRLPRDQHRSLLGVVPVDGQPRAVHDAGRRGAVDALGAAHRRRHRPLRRRLRRALRGAGKGVKRRAPDALDDPDKAIVELLQDDGRRSYTGLAAAVGLSEAAVRTRVQRLIENNVVQIVARHRPPPPRASGARPWWG